jgi:hypothetical protein
MTLNEHHYCSSLTAGAPDAADAARLSGRKAAMLLGAKWPVGSVVTVRFLDEAGDAVLRQRVQAVAEEWTKLANLTLDFRNDGPTDIRIAFMPGNGSWSYIGTMCRQIAEPLPTMNYGWLTPDSDEPELRRVVLHEFGHALGLIHEHQNPKGGGIAWNEDAVKADLGGPPNNWNLATIQTNMFRKYELSEVDATDVDPLSIMMYPIPKSWTFDGTSAGLNGELSATDREKIAQDYPF